MKKRRPRCSLSLLYSLSQPLTVIPRIPPMHMSTVTVPSSLEPWSFFRARRRSCGVFFGFVFFYRGRGCSGRERPRVSFFLGQQSSGSLFPCLASKFNYFSTSKLYSVAPLDIFLSIATSRDEIRGLVPCEKWGGGVGGGERVQVDRATTMTTSGRAPTLFFFPSLFFLGRATERPSLRGHQIKLSCSALLSPAAPVSCPRGPSGCPCRSRESETTMS